MTSDAPPASAARPGIEVPDRRGRTGLDREGRDLTGNPNVVIRDVELLSSSWYVLRKTTFDYRHRDGTWSTEHRETYDRGDGATVLLYDVERRTVLLTRQFRYPAYVNRHPDGMLLETVGGLLDEDDAETAIRREVEEEVGHRIGEVTRVFDVYMSPGSVTEVVHFYAAPYSSETVGGPGGGLADDGEDIELVELDFDDAVERIGVDIIDAKTIMLLQWAALRGPFRP
ncbi:NUDIX domain-containing protein [Naasia sp. SYSU D00057]|uniref:NUDIX domain-containing protein n=1 Tax=Naasia sp. SYSU D00057 TaxID=2817380 RepID=UPI001B311AD1|nr:NUDIX domain-containing protein [Naasia sp. SYSU D00057]